MSSSVPPASPDGNSDDLIFPPLSFCLCFCHFLSLCLCLPFSPVQCFWLGMLYIYVLVNPPMSGSGGCGRIVCIYRCSPQMVRWHVERLVPSPWLSLSFLPPHSSCTWPGWLGHAPPLSGAVPHFNMEGKQGERWLFFYIMRLGRGRQTANVSLLIYLSCFLSIIYLFSGQCWLINREKYCEWVKVSSAGLTPCITC